jgi:cobalt-zinc-cadmium efflux system membrane fusion protein
MRFYLYLIIGVVALLAGCSGKNDGPEASTSKGENKSDLANDEHAEHERNDAHGEERVVHLTQDQIERARIEIAIAAPATIREQITLYGTIVPNSERVRVVGARFPGVIGQVHKRVGDPVKRGERLATVESNESLKSYDVVASLSGVITERNANEGEQAREAALFTIADLSSVWAEIALFPRDVSKVRIGQTADVANSEGTVSSEGRVVYIAPLGTRANQTLSARVLLENKDGRWAPGLYVSVNVNIGETLAEVVVKNAAIQTLQDQSVVFVKTLEGFEARSVRLGKSDSKATQVLAGLKAGEEYAAENSFILKSELGAASAEHDH